MARDDRKIPDLVSVTEAAQILGRPGPPVSRQAVLKAIEAGHIPARKVGTTWVMRRAEVERAVERRAGYHRES